MDCPGHRHSTLSNLSRLLQLGEFLLTLRGKCAAWWLSCAPQVFAGSPALTFPQLSQRGGREDLEGHRLVQGKDENIRGLLSPLLSSDKSPDATADRQSHPPAESGLAGTAGRTSCAFGEFPLLQRTGHSSQNSSCPASQVVLPNERLVHGAKRVSSAEEKHPVPPRFPFFPLSPTTIHTQ